MIPLFFFLKKEKLDLNFVQHEEYKCTFGKICKVYNITTIDGYIYKARILISKLNTEIVQDLISYLFVCGDEVLEGLSLFK